MAGSTAAAYTTPAGRIVIPYSPRWYQAELHAQLERFNVLVLHRRSGKTVMAINELIKRIVECPHDRPFGAYIAPLYTQAKKVAWEYLRHYTQGIPGVRYVESELRVDIPGGRRIQLFGADNPDAMRGMYFDFVVLDEVAQMAPRTWNEVVRPALTDRRGGAIFIGTPQGKGNAFYQFYDRARTLDGWFRSLMTVDDTLCLDPEELEQAKTEMSDNEFAQEFYCSWEAAIKGAFYAQELGEARRQDRVTAVPWVPQYPVYTAWDLGYADATSIWFAQPIKRELRVINYMERTHQALLDTIAEVQQLRYNYAQHFAPHDIKQHSLVTGKTRLEMAAEAGIHFVITPRTSVEDGINAGKVMMRTVWIDENNCHDGLLALEQYRKDWDDRRQQFRKGPLHDWTSHAADAWRYLALNFDLIIRPTMGTSKPRVIRELTR